jgi:hypothetical protein
LIFCFLTTQAISPVVVLCHWNVIHNQELAQTLLARHSGRKNGIEKKRPWGRAFLCRNVDMVRATFQLMVATAFLKPWHLQRHYSGNRRLQMNYLGFVAIQLTSDVKRDSDSRETQSQIIPALSTVRHVKSLLRAVVVVAHTITVLVRCGRIALVSRDGNCNHYGQK